jgi:enoyl-CoA hydratase/carnithine racemase
MSALDEARRVLQALALGRERRPGRVRLELDGPVARLVLDNPASRNALTLGMMIELADHVQTLERWDGVAVLLVAEGDRSFCAGGHLDEVVEAIDGPERAAEMCRAMTEILGTFLDLPCISVAAIGAPAVGGGAELATACDFRVFGPRGVIHFVQARLGIASGWGGTGRLVRHVGPRAALGITAFAAPLDGPAALAAGLADRLVGAPVEEGALAFLAPILAVPPGAARAAKRQVVAAVRGEPDLDAAAFAERWGGPDHLAALAAMGRGR